MDNNNSRAQKAQLAKEISLYRGTAELTLMRKFLEIELDDIKEKLVGAAAGEVPAMQGGARVLRYLLSMLSKPASDIIARTESING